MPEHQSIKSHESLLRGVASELAIELTDSQFKQLGCHFAQLLKWNRKVNLTSLRDLEEIASRHFGESLFLTKVLPVPSGLMIDVGSGGGVPGLPLRIAWPSMRAVLLEPNRKKAAFLKEVIRNCGIQGAEVQTQRLDKAAETTLQGCASLVTVRAVEASEELLHHLTHLLGPGGNLALFLGAKDATRVEKFPGLEWDPAVAVPHSERRRILIGRLSTH